MLFTSVPVEGADHPWPDYFGSHYNPMNWAASVRDPGGVGIFFGPDNTRQVDVTRQFSRGVTAKAMILNPGGLGSGRDQEKVSLFMNKMLFDYGSQWKQQLQKKAESIAAVTDASAITWQFGNEINSQRFSQTLQYWNGGSNNSRLDSQAAIELYVEYYLAPGIEAIRRVKVDGKVAPFRVALGSIASFANPRAQTFLDGLLNYQIKGLFAPDLAGFRVFEVVDTVTVHYIVSANGDVWRDTLNRFYQSWFGKGKITALWSTEELGIRRAKSGAGAAFSLMVAARYLDWWSEKQMNPQQGRAFLWGSDVGSAATSGNAGMDFLLQLAGNSPLLPLTKKSLEITGDNIEAYGYRVGNSNRQLFFVFPGDQRSDAVLEHFSVFGVNKSVHISESRLFSREGQQPNVLMMKGNLLSAPSKLPAMSILVVVVDA